MEEGRRKHETGSTMKADFWPLRVLGGVGGGLVFFLLQREILTVENCSDGYGFTTHDALSGAKMQIM